MKGRKRHIVVDVLGLVLGCYVSAANVADVKAAPGVLVWVLEMYQRIVKVLADKGYRGDFGELLGHFFAAQGRQVEMEISQRPDNVKGFQVEPKRWIVARTWTWLTNARILARDYERLPDTKLRSNKVALDEGKKLESEDAQDQNKVLIIQD